MNKIRKYLESIGVSLVYDKSFTANHFGGRSFYNDGTYSVDVYRVGEKTEYSIYHKSSGRPQYWLYKNDNIVTTRFSQYTFIEEVLKKTFTD